MTNCGIVARRNLEACITTEDHIDGIANLITATDTIGISIANSISAYRGWREDISGYRLSREDATAALTR